MLKYLLVLCMLFLLLGCGSKKLPICNKPIGILIVVNPNDARQYNFSLEGITTDLKNVVWKVSNNIISNPLNYTFTNVGNYTLTAEYETNCGELATLNKTLSVNFKTCTVPTAITNLSSSGNTYVYGLTTIVASDIKSVTWKILNGSTVFFQEQRTDVNSISYSYTASGSYMISADIETICGEKLVLTLPSTITVQSITQAPSKVWDITLSGGNSQDDTLRGCSRVNTSDGGLLVAGSVNFGITSDKSESSKGSSDYWVIKLNSMGQKMWDKSFGGRYWDSDPFIVATEDGGFVLAGHSISDKSGDKSENSKGGWSDFWLIKINGNGQKVWDKTIGGSGEEYPHSVVISTDGNIVILGASNSNTTGDKSENSKGGLDFWVVKLNSNGQKLWDKTIGSSNSDSPTSMVSTSDGGVIITGATDSNQSGDKSENSKGRLDYWVVKLNNNGQKMWDKTFGGSGDDSPSSIVTTPDRNIIIVGSSSSNQSGDKSENSKGGADYWVVKIDGNGQKLWDKTFGGNSNDSPSTIVLSSDGGIIISGTSSSNQSGDKSENSKAGGEYYWERNDYWVIKLNNNGQKLWDKTIGGSSSEVAISMVLSSGGSIVIGGGSSSNKSGDKSENKKGTRTGDYWIVQLK